MTHPSGNMSFFLTPLQPHLKDNVKNFTVFVYTFQTRFWYLPWNRDQCWWRTIRIPALKSWKELWSLSGCGYQKLDEEWKQLSQGNFLFCHRWGFWPRFPNRECNGSPHQSKIDFCHFLIIISQQLGNYCFEENSQKTSK